MADTTTAAVPWNPKRTAPGALARLLDNKAFLVFLCLLPAVGLLLVFLTYPLGLGIWLVRREHPVQPGTEIAEPIDLDVSLDAAFAEIKSYYNDITLNNLELIKSLKASSRSFYHPSTPLTVHHILTYCPFTRGLLDRRRLFHCKFDDLKWLKLGSCFLCSCRSK